MVEYMLYKQSHQDLGLHGYSFAHYSEKCFILINFIVILYGDPCWCSLEGHQHAADFFEFCHRNEKLVL